MFVPPAGRANNRGLPDIVPDGTIARARKPATAYLDLSGALPAYSVTTIRHTWGSHRWPEAGHEIHELDVSWEQVAGFADWSTQRFAAVQE